MTPSRIFLYFCLSFISGIAISSFFTPHQNPLCAGLILGIILISVFWQYKKLVVIGFSILFLILGIWRHQALVELKIVNDELRNFNEKLENITLIGQVSKEPDLRSNNVKLEVKTKKLKINQEWKNISGKVLVTTERYPEYSYGDKLKITGRLLTPQKFPDFNYKDYLKKDGIYSVIYYPEIDLLEKSNYGGLTSLIYAKILFFKNKLRESIYQNLSPPQSSILGAIILGDKSRMSKDLKEKLNIAGLRHITCISGMHVAILTGILMSILIGFGLWRSQAFYFTLISITLFIVMTGLQPSAIRAGIMGGLFLLAQHLGRTSESSRAIIFAAAVMLALNPLLLKLDVGFQLSFLAMMGIIYLMPIFQNWLNFIFKGKLLGLKSILAMTLSAQIFTLPILIYNFGYLSLVAPATNVLIVPWLPLIMIFGFIFGLGGMVWSLLGWILSWPSFLFLTYVTRLVDWFSSFSFSSLTFQISWLWLIILYLILGFITWYLNKKYYQTFYEFS